MRDRKQEVLLEGVHSNPADVTSGVPQGTVLGPLLFLSYINDLPDVVNSSHTKLFADDCLLFKSITTARDQQLLQSDLTSLEQWEDDWQMEFNPSKCTVIRIRHSEKQILHHSNYELHDEILEITKSSKYLGVTITDNLSWSEHTELTAAKANRTLGFLRRNLYDCSTRVRSATYTTMVRPIIEYAAAAWDPHLRKDVQAIEAVQRRAARFACNNYSDRTPGCVDAMLQSLKWPSQEERRRNIRLAFLQKINNNLVDLDINNYVKKGDSRTRGSQRFHQGRASHPALFHSFFPRTVREWNKLPTDISSITSPEAFVERIGGSLSLTGHQILPK